MTIAKDTIENLVGDIPVPTTFGVAPQITEISYAVNVCNDTDVKFKMEDKCFGTAGITDVTITSSVNNMVSQLETRHQFHQIIALMSLRSLSLSLSLSLSMEDPFVSSHRISGSSSWISLIHQSHIHWNSRDLCTLWRYYQ